MLSARDRRLLRTILIGRSDFNIRFDDTRRLLLNLGFEERVRGSHHIFTKEGIADILNLQPRNSMAKAYQIRQIRRVVLNYGLAPDDA